MPSNPLNPSSKAAIERLTLGVESARGAEPSGNAGTCGIYVCFDAGSSGTANCSAATCGIYACFEVEPNGTNAIGLGACFCFEGE